MTVNKPYCIDIYQGDNVSDSPSPLAGFNLVKARGIPFCFHKASQNTTERDSRYSARRSAWMSGGPIAVTDIDGTKLSINPRWGAYHYLIGTNPIAEAKNFTTAATLEQNDAGCADWETYSASGACASAQQCDDFCSAVEDSIGRWTWVYGGNVPREQLSKPGLSSALLDRFASRRLWFCDYNNSTNGLVPIPWAQSVGPTLWQDDGDKYGPGPHTIPGISNYCDNSTVVGAMTVAKVNAIWSGFLEKVS